MQKLKTLCLLLALLASFGFGAAWTGANSEPENTKKMDGKTFYVITTADELAWFAAQVNSGNGAINAVLANDIVFGKDTNTVNAQNAWTPIGKDSTHTFRGVIDGAGYSIYGVYTEKTLAYGGLVGVLDSVGVVRNVNMKKDSINAYYYAGGLVAYNYGMVSGCTNGGSVSSTSTTYYYTGGIVGYNTGMVSGCTNSGCVSSTSTSISGGIVGRNTGTVIGCTNDGSVSSTVTTSSSVYSASSGGIAGHNTGTVSGCTNGGSVFSTTFNSYYYIGGIVGYNQGSVSGCKNGGSVSSTITTTYYYTGGIVGYNKGTVSGCMNSGGVSSYPSYIGGIVGRNERSAALVKNSYSVAISLGSKGTRGGVAGFNKSSSKIINCYYDSDKIPSVSAVGRDSATSTNAFGMTTANMQRDQFAWILNTANGSEKNGGVWSRNGGYPIFANATYLPIYKVVFSDDGATSNRYTDYRGLVSFPGDPEPAEGYMFSGWYNAENVKVKASTVFSADQTLNAVYEELILRSVFIYGDSGEILDTAKVEENEKFVLPEAPEKKGYEFVGWYDDGDKFLGNPGDTITVTDDLKILAKYEETKLSSSSAKSSSSVGQSSSSAKASSSSETQSSSSTVQSSSSGVNASSSSAEPSSSSSEGSEALRFAARPRFGLQVQNRTIWVQNARVGKNFSVLDMQGRVLRRGIANSSELSFDVQNAGTYIVRVGTESLRVRIK